jgi:hypothetical protein
LEDVEIIFLVVACLARTNGEVKDAIHYHVLQELLVLVERISQQC